MDFTRFVNFPFDYLLLYGISSLLIQHLLNGHAIIFLKMSDLYCSCFKCLLTDDGISIPCSYTSYLCPVQSSKLYNEVRLCKEKDKHALNHFETPYVVHLQNRFQLAPTQPLFTFFHPNKGKKDIFLAFS